MLKINNLNFSYGDRVVFKDFCAEFDSQKINFLVGESGSGKTTLLKILAGLLPDGGAIEGNLTKVSYMFQEPRLVPQLNVLDNIKLALSSQKQNPNNDEKSILNMLAEAGLDGSAYLYPKQLSGGMAQRTALVRTFLFEADLMLLDEPFKALDEGNKTSMKKLLKAVQNNQKQTVIYVTHDLDDITGFEGSRVVKI